MAVTRFVSLTLLVCVRHEQCPGNYCFVVHSSTSFPLTLCHAVSVAKVQSEGVSGGQRATRASAGCVIRAHLFCLRKVIAKVVSIFQKRERGRDRGVESVRVKCSGMSKWAWGVANRLQCVEYRIIEGNSKCLKFFNDTMQTGKQSKHSEKGEGRGRE